MKIAAVSSTMLRNIKRVLGKVLDQRVSFYECHTGFFSKAHHLRKALSQAGGKADEATIIGDEIRDIGTARQVDQIPDIIG